MKITKKTLIFFIWWSKKKGSNNICCCDKRRNSRIVFFPHFISSHPSIHQTPTYNTAILSRLSNFPQPIPLISIQPRSFSLSFSLPHKHTHFDNVTSCLSWKPNIVKKCFVARHGLISRRSPFLSVLRKRRLSFVYLYFILLSLCTQTLIVMDAENGKN